MRITVQQLDQVADGLRSVVHEIEDAQTLPLKPWSGARVDAARRRAIVLIDQVLAEAGADELRRRRGRTT